MLQQIMAAKEKDDSVRGPAAKKAVGKRPAKKRGSNRSRTGTSVSGSNTPLPPEILADLAVKLVRLNTAAPTDHSRRGPQLASPAFDDIFSDALKRAEMLLMEASGRSDQDVHAYQLFTQDDGLMSFKEIAGRFGEFGWNGMKSPNTVTSVIEQLVNAAEIRIQKERERSEKLDEVRRKYPGGVYHLADRARDHIRRMINLTGLRELFDEPEKAADAMGQVFYRLMENQIRGDWEIRLDEELADCGHESFIRYVCGGLSYEQFIKEPPEAWLTFDHLDSLIFFLENLSEPGKSGFPISVAQDFESLMRLAHGHGGIPSDVISGLDACLKEGKKKEPDTARVLELASNACISLKSMRDRWYLSRLCSDLSFGGLLKEVRGRSKERKRNYKVSVAKAHQILALLRPVENAKNTTEPFMDAGQLRQMLDDARHNLDVRDSNRTRTLPIAKIRRTLKLLRWADKAGSSEGTDSMNADQLRSLLDDLRNGLRDPELIAVARVPARSFNGSTIADEMQRVAEGIEKGLRIKPPAKRHRKTTLWELLRDLRPYDGDRKCRPYELFLFAAQQRLLAEKLVTKRSELKASPIPNPSESKPMLSILDHHRGADFD